ncbi:hypothetical protein P171DRAFT_354930 [Karstenula rhodostoma CBS 690.94]|uniref:SUZ domain-containing protein n=1 Tax=Karstenula rhodostoma CBS 690.94 TaxID=1392251 RepID=A0A9P4PQP3_9PLEO|nr:hypothetical protein P171DRAFT_354930 [Karstenula rhodostoma CBS 690.94]
MPPKQSALADAWDEDWESLADQVDAEQKNEPAPKVKLSQKERRAQHAEQQRMLWDSAENPEPMIFLEARNNVPVPVQSTFKPAVTLLARKPKAPAGMAGLSLDDDDDSEEERRKKSEAEFEERKARAHKERAEKERRYAEAREKIFGTPANSDESRGASPRRAGKGRGGRGGRDNQPRSSNEQSPARPSAPRQLFEPAYSPKPGSLFVQKKDGSTSRPGTPNNQEKPIREPRGPQATGRGGRGFAPRGNRTGTVS